MDSVLAEIYSTVLSGAPYVIAAYALLWCVLCTFVVILLIRFKRVEREIEVLEDSLENRRRREDVAAHCETGSGSDAPGGDA